MLLPDNISPKHSIYYNASFVLKALLEEREVEMVNLYHLAKEAKDMSFPIFILCLDWLYLINVAEFKEGRVALCS